jgi:hypothetical protein
VNDAERRRSPDGFDDDAIFADIVAHLNDEAAEPGQPDRPPAEDASPGGQDASAGGQDTAGTEDAAPLTETADEVTDETNPGPTTASAPDNPSEESSPVRRVHWSINPPPGPPSPVDPSAEPAAQVWRAHEAGEEEEEEHFEPPPVTPLPVGDLQFWAIIAGMTCGPLLLLYLVFFNRYASSYWILIAIGLSVGGFAMLVSRMPGRHDDDDDGARL